MGWCSPAYSYAGDLVIRRCPRAPLPYLQTTRRGGCMPVIVVANPKGGRQEHAGDNLAGWLAHQGHAVMRRRPPAVGAGLAGVAAGGLPRISTWTSCRQYRAPATRARRMPVLDTPAGLHGKRLDAVMKLTDCVSPLQPSIFRHPRDARLRAAVAGAQAQRPGAPACGMRRESTLAAEHLQRVLPRSTRRCSATCARHAQLSTRSAG